MTYYSCLELHNDGSWWYHGNTFSSREEADAFIIKWIWFDDHRTKRIFEHSIPFPPFPDFTHSYYTKDLHAFYLPGGGDAVINFSDD